MAAYSTYSQSLRLLSTDPVTPLHSPHHSVNSSTSSRTRTPLQPLTLHQYRKQQNSPAPQLATPPGKTLRRRPATPALNDLERTSSASYTPLSASRPAARPLHVSYSAHQLTYQSLPPSPPPCGEEQTLLGQPFRSQSAEPYSQVGSRPQLQHSAEKVRKFKSIKRLPKPPVASGFSVPSPLAITPTLLPQSPGYTSYLNELLHDDSEHSPPDSSIDPLPRPQLDRKHTPAYAVNTTSFVTAGPETPPATPAVIHYRGASFDLVNPHDSLCLANIETPSRDLDSTDHLSLSSYDQSASPEMGPKRALYGDLSSAYTSIRTRRGGEDNPTAQALDFPMPPAPAARLPETPTSPDSYAPLHSPDSHYGLSPFPSQQSPQQTPTESRFSLKQLTRSLTKKLGKTSQTVHEEELQDMSHARSRIGLASPAFEGSFPRSLDETYRQVDAEADASQLKSMVPDEQSAQITPGTGLSIPTTAESTSAGEHYDDLRSLYPTSSIYSDSRPQSFQPSLAGNRQSHVYARLKGNSGDMADQYRSHTASLASPYTIQQPLEPLQLPRQRKTDTIGRLIDQYQGEGNPYPPPLASRRPTLRPTREELDQSMADATMPSAEAGRATRFSTGQGSLDPFKYDTLLGTSPYIDASDTVSGVSSYGDTRHLLQLSNPLLEGPSHQRTLDPSSSYSQPEEQIPSPTTPQAALDQADRIFEQSTPQDVLEQADKIFGNVPPEEAQEQEDAEEAIPPMWARRTSVNIHQSSNPFVSDPVDETDLGLLEGEDQDWETVRNSSQTQPSGRVSLGESTADYSDAESQFSRDSKGFRSNPALSEFRPAPLYATSASSSRQYAHQVPATSQQSAISPLRAPSSPPPSSPFPARPGANLRGTTLATGSPQGPYTPWVNRGQFSDKETQELLASGPNDEIIYNDSDREASENRESSLNASSTLRMPTYHERANTAGSPLTRVMQTSSSGSTPRSKTTRLHSERPSHDAFGNSPQQTRLSRIQQRTLQQAVLQRLASEKGKQRSSEQFYAGTEPGYTSSATRVRPGHAGISPYVDSAGSQASAYATNDSPLDEISVIRDPRRHGSRATATVTPGPSSGQSPPGLAAVTGQRGLLPMMLTPTHARSARSNRNTLGSYTTHTVTSGRPSTGRPSTGRPSTGRPSTANTETPLYPQNSQHTEHAFIAHEDTPHLLRPERAMAPEDEKDKVLTSWLLFGAFCLLPPLLPLYRHRADFMVTSVTQGRVRYAADAPKKYAFKVAIILNIGIIICIVLPIVVAHAHGTL
ncbi:unnamed protein product [Periconia digitata]|uniref:Uncharacterized protein n=1 Tax=Periconia digitata TaxID=1303443 RepID=A0A9W4U4D1_9PLEO|nr:unnamed protein product [Periconia digitata]